jgi:hypothetical protein
MRLLALCAVAACGACSTTTFAEPRILVSPYLALYQVRGEIGMQSPAPVPGDPPVDNAPQTLRTFGQDHHREDVGVRADIGDGFAGVRIDYYKLDQGTSRAGVINDDWGNLLAGDTVSMEVEMDELRIGYLEPVGTVRTTWRDRPLTFRGALGGTFLYRSMDMRASTVDEQRTQNAEIEGDVVAISGRMRAAWHDFAFDVDYSISPELTLDGDFEGLIQDLELRGSWTIPMHDVTFSAAYRWSAFEASGRSGSFAYDADLTIDGFQFGVSVTF